MIGRDVGYDKTASQDYLFHFAETSGNFLFI